MERDIETMAEIQDEKEKEIETRELQPLDAEGVALAEHKRFTFDVINIPSDPLR